MSYTGSSPLKDLSVRKLTLRTACLPLIHPHDAVTGEKLEQVKHVPGVNSDHWAKPNFRILAKNGVINTDKTINPDKSVSRAEFTKMLVLATYLLPLKVETPVFSDVSLSSPYIGYIEQAYKKGIIAGSDGKFNPDKPITRQEVAVVLIKALKAEERIDPKTKFWGVRFNDESKMPQWAIQEIQQAAELGYMKGYNYSFNPAGSLTWAEAAALLSKYMNVNEY